MQELLLAYPSAIGHGEGLLQLCMEGYYDGTIFHRLIKDFMLQGAPPDRHPELLTRVGRRGSHAAACGLSS